MKAWPAAGAPEPAVLFVPLLRCWDGSPAPSRQGAAHHS